MADLTIKPQAGSSNKLILQDQQGGTVLETATSGATLGNSTQDNITRLGTVTTGTLGSSVAMPAGRVLNISQQWLSSDTAVFGTHGTSNGQQWATFWTVSYTPTQPSVKVYAILHPWLRVWANVTTNNHINFRYTIAGSNVSDGAGTNIGQQSNGGTVDGMIWGDWGANSSSYWRHTTHNMMFSLRGVTTSGGTGAITYTLDCQNPNAINGNCGWRMYGDSLKEQTSMIFMEVEY